MCEVFTAYLLPCCYGLHPMACGLVARIHLTLTKHKRPSTCLLAGLLAAFLIFAPSFLGLFFFNSGGMLVTNVEAVGP